MAREHGQNAIQCLIENNVVFVYSVKFIFSYSLLAAGKTFTESLLPSGLEIKHCTENCEKVGNTAAYHFI